MNQEIIISVNEFELKALLQIIAKISKSLEINSIICDV